MADIKHLPMLLGLSFLAAAAQTPSSTGRWIVSTDYLGTPLTPLLNLEQTDEKVTATSRGYKYVGTLHGTALHLIATDERGNTDEIAATLAAGKMEGTDTETAANDKAHPMTLKFTAVLAPALEHPQPRTHLHPDCLLSSHICLQQAGSDY